MSPAALTMIVDFSLLQGPEDLHVFLGCDEEVAGMLLHARDDDLFIRHHIPKKSGKGTREVWEVRGDRIGDVYKALARKLNQFIRSRLSKSPHDSVHGYVAGRSTLTNARAHIGVSSILKADIKSFFRSIRAVKVATLFGQLGLSDRAANALTGIVARDDHLPLGLPTSPVVANAVCHALDGRLAALVPGGVYTRYADDLSFSGPLLPTREAIEGELAQEGFKLADAKWRLSRAGRGLYITGLSLEDRCQPRVPKAMKRRLRQDLYYAARWGLVPHLGFRSYGAVQSGINKIDGLIRYIRGIEPGVGLACHAKWTEVLREAGQEVSYPKRGAVVARKVLFVVDESVVIGPRGSVLMLALVVIEDTDLVRGSLNNFLETLTHNPYGASDKKLLAKKGLHWNDLALDDRTKVTEWIRALPFRCFLAFESLAAEDKETYAVTYENLFVKLVQGRLVRYDRCTIDVVAEENSKVDHASVSASVAKAYERLGKAKSRRPATAPSVQQAAKGKDAALPLPDIVMGIFGDYARTKLRAAEEAQDKKKRVSGDQADKRFEQIRDKVRAIFDLDSGEVFSRRVPFEPWEPVAASGTHTDE